ncbi:hypothetical protein H2248_011560 [Termitomyces sp. 'cryptogamus']|nr:hypothetical protein H2248_011560 [Termitomyces sp. 'cryptogamus']
MLLTMSSRMSSFILLTLAWRVVTQVPTQHLATRQEDLPSLTFVNVSNAELTSCASASFIWTYTGPDGPFSFFIIATDVTQTATSGPLPTSADSSNPNARSLYRRDNVNVQIASSISPFRRMLNLTSLPVPPGRYRLLAVSTSLTVPPYIQRSGDFTVQEGNDTSCLTSSPTSSTSLTSTLSSSATSSDLTTITSSVMSSESTSTTAFPVGGVSTNTVNKGAIAGGVVAGAVVLIAVVAFYFFFIVYPRRSRTHSRAPGGPHGHTSTKRGLGVGNPGGKDEGGRWGGLASVDSHLPSDSNVQKTYVNAGRQSHGAGASQDDINSYLSRSGSANYGGYVGSPSEEKFSSSPSEEMMLSTLPYRSPETNLHAPNNNARAASPAALDYRHSQSTSWRSSLDSTSAYTQSPFATPPVLSPASLTRPTLTGVQKSSRKTARKPVPAYDDSVFPATSTVTSSPVTPATKPYADPVLPHAAAASFGHYSTRAERESLKSHSSKSKSKLRNKDKSNTSSANASNEEIAQQGPVLAHKSSFGPGGIDGKLHYLIPDMPMGHR